MTSLVNAIQSVELKTALQPLTISGAYGEIFDADTDSLQLSSWQTFEMQKLMATPAIVGSTLMYIFHRIEQSLTGAPTLIILDECWVFFNNEQFAQKIREWLKVLRKANASVVFATQSLTDIVESPIFSTVLESCPSQIFLPNDKALEESLKEKYFMFGLNQRQVEIIAGAVKKKQYKAQGVFARLIAAGERLMAVIQKCEGMANKDLAKFADQINSLCDKWDR